MIITYLNYQSSDDQESGIRDITPSFKDNFNKGSRILEVSWSPNGNYIALARYGELGYLDLESEEYTPLENALNIGILSLIEWKDENIICYTSEEKLYEINIKTGENNLVYSNESNENIESISWDDENERYLIILESSTFWLQEENVTFPNMENEDVLYGALSPNNKLIVYISYSPNKKGELEDLKVYDIEQEVLKLRYDPPKKEMLLRSLSWSPDSKWIAFYGGSSEELSGIYIVSAEGNSSPQKVSTIFAGNIDWSPKGNQLVVSTIGSPSRNELLIVDLPEEYHLK